MITLDEYNTEVQSIAANSRNINVAVVEFIGEHACEQEIIEYSTNEERKAWKRRYSKEMHNYTPELRIQAWAAMVHRIENNS